MLGEKYFLSAFDVVDDVALFVLVDDSTTMK